ncbi:hypothetical protein F7725_020316 [Dissostichus mawsoni]|uniref:Uncharacterized protein n=1 Tax=Dissostichus mawsoni TaxID=36200 RepID=A0A7J5YG84_DISMA|nr:hypothetical protein F7725_020316 [Dissostichus mawsoni]
MDQKEHNIGRNGRKCTSGGYRRKKCFVINASYFFSYNNDLKSKLLSFTINNTLTVCCQFSLRCAEQSEVSFLLQ